MNGDRYGLPNKERTDIVGDWFVLGVTRWLPRIGKPPMLSPKAGDFIAAGCLLEVHPVIPDGKKEGGILIEQDKITYAVVPLSQAEIEAQEVLAELEANIQKLKDLHITYKDMAFWRGKTDDDISDLVDLQVSGTTAEIIAGIKVILKRLGRAERDDVALFDLQRETGILPK